MLQVIETNKKQPVNDDTIGAMVGHYLHQFRSITLIRMLVPLFISSQQHRGASLALLGGNDQFKKKVQALESEINHRLLTLGMLNQEFKKPIDDLVLEQLDQEWGTVREWFGGTPLENFKLQSHFIEQQLRLIWTLTEKTNWFSPKTASMDEAMLSKGNPTTPSSTTDALLVKFVLQEIPELIELIAKIRGLATHASVLEFCDEEHRSWLEYLLKLLNQKKEKFRNYTRQLQAYVLGDVPGIIDLQMQDISIVSFVSLVEKQILREKAINVQSEQVFDMATEIIKSHTAVINQGLSFIRNKVNDQLDYLHVDHG